MTMQISAHHLADAQPAPHGFHPLANPFVEKVCPFWVNSDESDIKPGDLRDPAALFNPQQAMEDDGLLHLEREIIRQQHGDDVADDLEGRTGLYVVVNDLEQFITGVSGRLLSSCYQDRAEIVMETVLGILIFTENRQSVDHQTPLRLVA